MKKERLITNNNKKQFFLSMSKKQLISSLAVTTMLINPITSNAFANSNDILSSANTETELINTTESNDSTETSNAGSLSRCAPDNNGGVLGIVGNGDLKVPTQCDKVKKQESIQHTVPKPKDGKTTKLDRFMTYDCNRTGDEYIVRVNKTGDYDNHTYNYGDAGNNYTFNNFKVEYTVTTTDEYKDKGYQTSSKPGCHNMKNEKQVNFTVTTQEGATLGEFPGMKLDEKIEFNDAKKTVQYKFHCIASGGGQQFIDINLVPIYETISTETALESALKDESLEKIVINGQVNVNKELTVNRNNVTIVGENSGCIDFQNKGSLVLKANNIKVSDLTIKNSAKAGIQVYKSTGVILNKVNVEKSKNYGILVNSSTVTLNDCGTSNNNSGGIMACRATNILSKHGGRDSEVTVNGSLNQEESSPKVMVKNSRMIDVNKNNCTSYYMQENKFISNLKDKKYCEIESKIQDKNFCQYYNKDVQKALKGINIEQYKCCNFEEKTSKYDVK